MKLEKRVRNCLVGSALGDAFAAPIQHDNIQEIKLIYGDNGLDYLEPWGMFSRGSYTAYTQTKLKFIHNIVESNINNKKYINNNFSTEYGTLEEFNLDYFNHRFIWKDDEQRKVNLAIAKSIPMGLIYKNPEEAYIYQREFNNSIDENMENNIYLGILSFLISDLINVSDFDIEKSVQNAIGFTINNYLTRDISITLKNVYNTYKSCIEYKFDDLTKKFGHGYTVKEAMCISIYCCLVHKDDFDNAIRLSANHSGNSISTSAITGAIVGLLSDELPNYLESELEDIDIIESYAKKIKKYS